ncbi:MAG TPA: 3-oxoadipate enol-lactonase [Terriglobales bacterium]|jgi:3-oxoadipate enol-lactonase
MRLLDPLFGWEAVEYALAARLGRKRARALVAAACERLRQGHHDLYQELAAEPELAEALPELAPLFDPTHNLGQSEPLVRRALAAHDSTPATRTLQLAHQKIGYELKGSATAPVVVLAHALGANLTLWDAQTVALTPHFRVLRYDLRGHGQTSTPTGAYTLDQLGNDVVALLDSLGVPRVHFCGISLGGLIGLWLGLHAPERLHSLVLANTAARIDSEQSWNERILQVRQNGLAPLIEPTLDRWLSPATRHRCPGVARAARAMIAATPTQGYLGCCAVLRDTDLRQQIAAIRLPTLIIAGREDESTPTQQARFLAAEIPGARFAELDTAHISSLGAAPQFNDELRRFWGIGE